MPPLILIVSSSTEDQVFLCRLCEAAGWRTCRAATCREALACAAGHRPAVAVCDSILSDGTWRDLARSLGGLNGSPALVVASREPEDLWPEVRRIGGCDVLAKPFDHENTLRVVGLALLSFQWRGGHAAPRCRPRTCAAR